MECLGGVAKIKAHVASHLLVKTVLAVESRSSRYYRLLSDNDIWDLVWFGLRKSSDPDVWTLCLKVSRDNYRYLVHFRSSSTTVDGVRNMLDVVVDRHGRTLAQRSLSSAEVLMDFLKSAVWDKFFLAGPVPEAGVNLLAIVYECLMRYTSVGSPSFIAAIINVCCSLGKRCSVQRWLYLCWKTIVSDGQWRELCKAPHDNLCTLLQHAVPRVLLDGRRSLDLSEAQARASCDGQVSMDAIVGTWVNVLHASPWCVTASWISGCCRKNPSWFGEAVLLQLVDRWHAAAAAAEEPSREAYVTACFVAVFESYTTRLEEGVVIRHVGDNGWSDMVCTAVLRTWPLYQKVSSESAYASTALRLLGASVYVLTSAFVAHPGAVDVVKEAMHTMPVSSSLMLCVRNGLASLQDSPGLSEFQRVVKAWVLSMAEDKFAVLLQPVPWSSALLGDFFWVLYYLDHEVGGGLFALRTMHSLVQVKELPSANGYAYRALRQTLLSLMEHMASAEHVRLVLKILVDVYFPPSGGMRRVWTWDVRDYSSPLAHIAKLLQSDDSIRDVCVDPLDSGWNFRLFQLVATVYDRDRRHEPVGVKSWLLLLIPFICSPLPQGLSEDLVDLVQEQLVRACLYYLFLYLFLAAVIGKTLCCFFCSNREKYPSGVRPCGFCGWVQSWTAAAETFQNKNSCVICFSSHYILPTNQKTKMDADKASLQKFLETSEAGDIWTALGAPSIAFSDVGFLLKCLGGVASVKGHVASSMLIKAVLAVACRSASSVALDVCELMEEGLLKSYDDPEMLTLCFKFCYEDLSKVKSENEVHFGVMMDTWVNVLSRTPWCVTTAWISECCNNWPSLIGEAVLLRLVDRWHATEEDAFREAHVTACFVAVFESYKARLEKNLVNTRTGDNGWSDMVCMAVLRTWPLYKKASSAYAPTALALLALSVYVTTPAFVTHPDAVGVVTEAMHTMPVSVGMMMCVRNGLVSLRFTAALPGFQRHVQAWVTRMAEDKFFCLQPVKLFSSVFGDFFWALHSLHYEPFDGDMASGLFALRTVHTLVQHLQLSGEYAMNALHGCLFQLLLVGATKASAFAEHVSLVLRILVDVYYPPCSGFQRNCALGACYANVMTHVATLLSRDASLFVVCVDAHDNTWNVRLFCLLAELFRDLFSTILMPWILRLIPSICSPIPVWLRLHVQLQDLVRKQLVRINFFCCLLFFSASTLKKKIRFFLWTGQGGPTVVPAASTVDTWSYWRLTKKKSNNIILLFSNVYVHFSK